MNTVSGETAVNYDFINVHLPIYLNLSDQWIKWRNLCNGKLADSYTCIYMKRAFYSLLNELYEDYTKSS